MMKRQLFDKLDFSKVLQAISQWVHSEVSKERLSALTPMDNIDEIRLRSEQIEELRKMRQQGINLTLDRFEDITVFIKKVIPIGAMLDAIELYNFIPFLYNTEGIISMTGASNQLKKISDKMCSHQDLLRKLKRSVNHEGEVLDSASNALREIRKAIKNLEGKIRKKLEDIIQSEEYSVFLQDTFITKRSGRWVIPVRMDSKGQVSGVVHDVSKSGETAFIEPLSIINLTNELEALRAEEKLEEVKILKELSQTIRTYSDELTTNFDCLIYFDILNAISIYADNLSMEPPIIQEEMEISLFRARHALLYSNLKNRGIEDQLVPLDINLHHLSPIMVITGPNAGGKTVVIKTVGLLVIMALSGMPIPAASMSRIPFVKKILADIGDEQSIEDSLSTFAGHISNLTSFIDEADKSTLVLIDELGTGTDPFEGAALSSSILEELRDKGALVIANTHLSEIKGFVHKTEGMINAAMEFDPKTFKPLYKLTIGIPGQSYAFETALRYGLPERVVNSARGILGSQKIDLDNLIRELQDKRTYYENQSTLLQKRHDDLSMEKERIKAMLDEASRQKEEIVLNAYKESQDIITKTKEELYHLLEEAKRLDKQNIKSAIKKTVALGNELDKAIDSLKPKAFPTVTIDNLSVGDRVYSKIANDCVTVLSINKKQKRLKIGLNDIEFDVPIEDIKGIYEKQDSKSGQTSKIIGDEDRSITSINLIGKRVDEALSEIEPFLNHSFLSGLSETLIIHGIGTGALKKALRDYLKGHSLIKDFRDGSTNEGGSGVTVVRFK